MKGNPILWVRVRKLGLEFDPFSGSTVLTKYRLVMDGRTNTTMHVYCMRRAVKIVECDR